VASLLNPFRPPVFCPGCSHERSLHALDAAFHRMGLGAGDIAIVSDIGCSGLFDTYFNTHALHGLHGRALTYAAGVKLAQPHLKVVVTMGDGGLGIGGAHLLAACRRNLDLTLLVLNNFNFGMTGGQFSCTTSPQATVASGFLNALEKPMDVCTVAVAAGAPFAARVSIFSKDLSDLLIEAIAFEGFSLVDIWGACPGRYLKRNALSSKTIDEAIGTLPSFDRPVPANARLEYGRHYREKCTSDRDAQTRWQEIETLFAPAVKERREVMLLGTAGERVISAGSLLAHAAILAGMHVSQKNDYNITVMRGPSVTELILSPEPIAYTGVDHPDVIIALSDEGVKRRADAFQKMRPKGRVIRAKGLSIPATPLSCSVIDVDFATLGIEKKQRALAALSLLARSKDPITPAMLDSAVYSILKGKILSESLDLLRRAATIQSPAHRS
jgi:2-oxoglutarate ferredoxin oxidoreductase subunit beta